MDKEQNPFQWPCAEPCLPITPKEPAWLQTPTSGLQSASFPCDFAVCGFVGSLSATLFENITLRLGSSKREREVV